VLLTVIATLLFGIAIPVAVGIDGADQAEAGAVNLTAAQEAGREKFAKACQQCHTLAATNATGRVGPNLDVIRPPKELTVDAILKGRARGRGQMPSLLFTGRDAEEVAEFVAAVAGRD
jgi:mono/diheme cytochrome c family protein